MSIENRLYAVVGVTVDAAGVAKVRYSGEDFEAREKLYVYLGAKLVRLVKLPKPLNKIDACKHLLALSDFKQYVEVIETELAKKEALVAPKVPKKRGPKPKAKSASVPAPKKAAKAAKGKVKAKAKAAPVAAPFWGAGHAKAKATADTAVPVLDKGEVETLIVEEDYDHDFDVEQFEKIAASQD
jgi:hypothetical protein